MKLEDLEQTSIALYDVRSQLQDHVFSRSVKAHAAGDKERDQIDSMEKLEEHNMYMRTKFLEGMGGLPPGDTPLHAKQTGVVHCDGFTVENIIFESREDTPVTANLYLPDGLTTPRGAVLHVLGHSPEPRPKEGYQAVCQYLARAGLVVFAFDPIGQGERSSYYDPDTGETTIHPGTPDHEKGGVQSWPLGQWETRYFLHDIIRAVDYMCTRPEIDSSRLGITGVSGGGMQTLLAMLCEPRFAAAAPVCYTTSREAKMYSGKTQDAEQIWPGVSAIGFEHEDFLLAFAPKPLLVLAGTGDFFPIEGTHKTVSRSRRFWEWFGKGNQLQLHEEDCKHSYSRSMARAAAVFFARHLLDRDVSVEDVQIRPLEPGQLQCTSSGQVRGDDPGTKFVYEENCDVLDELERKRASLSEKTRRERAQKWLSKTVYGPRQLNSSHLNARYPSDAEQVDGEQLSVQSVLWKSQEGLFNHGTTFRDSHLMESHLPVTLAIWEGGTTQLQSHLSWIRDVCREGRMVFVLDMTGSGPLRPYPSLQMDENTILGKLSRDLFWINDSLAAIRILDVLRALDMAESLRNARPADLQVYAHGRYSLYPQLAAMLDQRLEHLQVEEGFGSVADWIRTRDYKDSHMSPFILPGMLEYMDIS